MHNVTFNGVERVLSAATGALAIKNVGGAHQLVFHLFDALAEFERHLMRERTLAGLKSVRARGRKGGRRRELSVKNLKTVRADLK